MNAGPGPAAALVRRHDPDRFLAALFAPAAQREMLFLLYAFNHELARAREVASQPTLALIRLHWWREVVEGTPKRHEIATPLATAVAAGQLSRASLLAMIDGREAEADIIATRQDWLAYVMATAGELAFAAGHALGAAAEGLRPLGAAYGVAGILRSRVSLARQGRCLLPADMLADAGLTIEQAVADPDNTALTSVLDQLRAEGCALLRGGGGVPRAAIAAALPAILARRDLARAEARPRGLVDRLAVLAAGLRGRV